MRSRTGRLTFGGAIGAAFLSSCILVLSAPPLDAQSLFGWPDYDRAMARARAAQEAGDCVAFNRNLRDAKEIVEGLPLSRGTLSAGDQLIRTTANRAADDLAAEGCPKRTPTLAGPRGTLYQPSVEVGLDMSADTVTVPTRRFLGLEPMGSFRPQLGLFTPDDEGDGTSVSGFVKIDMTNFFNLPFGQNPPKTSFVRFGIIRSEFDITQSIGSINPGANNNLLIPGPLGGPSGFSLGANPLNIVTGAQYGLDYAQTGFTGDVGIESDYPYWAWPTHLTGYVHGGVYDIKLDERFSGMIPGFNRDFAYGTNVDATRTIYGVGIDGRSRIAGFSAPGQPDFWDVALRYAGEFGGFRVNGDGTDSLSFTGFQTSTAHLDASDSGTYYKLGVGLEMQGGPMKSYVMLNYENMGGFPVVARDGTNPSQLQFDDGEVWSVKFGVSVGFGQPVTRSTRWDW